MAVFTLYIGTIYGKLIYYNTTNLPSRLCALKIRKFVKDEIFCFCLVCSAAFFDNIFDSLKVGHYQYGCPIDLLQVHEDILVGIHILGDVVVVLFLVALV